MLPRTTRKRSLLWSVFLRELSSSSLSETSYFKAYHREMSPQIWPRARPYREVCPWIVHRCGKRKDGVSCGGTSSILTDLLYTSSSERWIQWFTFLYEIDLSVMRWITWNILPVYAQESRVSPWGRYLMVFLKLCLPAASDITTSSTSLCDLARLDMLYQMFHLARMDDEKA